MADQAGTKSELLLQVAWHMMHELVRAIFAHFPELDHADAVATPNGSDMPSIKTKVHVDGLPKENRIDGRQFDNGSEDSNSANISVPGAFASQVNYSDDKMTGANYGVE